MSSVEVKRKEGESSASFLYRFSKKIQQSGVLKETKKRRFHGRPRSRRQRLLSALHRETKKKEIGRLKKLGLI